MASSRKRQRRKPDIGAHLVHAAALFDVQLLDVFAQIEALLRKGREAQREALRVRGEPGDVTNTTPSTSAAKIARLTASMREDHRELGDVLRGLRRRANEVNRLVRERSRRK
jgi:hypothetical protein